MDVTAYIEMRVRKDYQETADAILAQYHRRLSELLKQDGAEENSMERTLGNYLYPMIALVQGMGHAGFTEEEATTYGRILWDDYRNL